MAGDNSTKKKRKKRPINTEAPAKKKQHKPQKRHHDVAVVRVGEGIESLSNLRREVNEMTDVLLGREPMPINAGPMTMQEVATAYYARACEMEGRIHRAESDGVVLKNSKHYRFRTGELRSFLNLAKAKMDLGSRRITAMKAEAEFEMRM